MCSFTDLRQIILDLVHPYLQLSSTPTLLFVLFRRAVSEWLVIATRRMLRVRVAVGKVGNLLNMLTMRIMSQSQWCSRRHNNLSATLPVCDEREEQLAGPTGRLLVATLRFELTRVWSFSKRVEISEFNPPRQRQYEVRMSHAIHHSCILS